MNTQLVIFDMDGVLFEGDNFWLDLHRKFRTATVGTKLAKKYLRSNYELLVENVAGKLWKGKSAPVYEQLVADRRYHPGVREVFEFIHLNKINSAILSSGPYDLAKRAQNELGIDVIYANRLIIKNEKIIGKVDVMVEDSEKAKIGKKLAKEMSIDLSNVTFIGDTDSDVELAIQVGLPIAYNSKSSRLKKVCKYSINYGELRNLIKILQSN